MNDGHLKIMSILLDTLPKDLVQLIISKLDLCTSCVDELLYTLMSLAKVSDYLHDIVKEFVILSYYSNEYVDGLTYYNYKGDRVGPSIQYDHNDVELLNHDSDLLSNSCFGWYDTPNYFPSNCFPTFCNGVLYSYVDDHNTELPDYDKPEMIVDRLAASGVEIAVMFKTKIIGYDEHQLLPKPMLMLLNANKKAEVVPDW